MKKWWSVLSLLLMTLFLCGAVAAAKDVSSDQGAAEDMTGQETEKFDEEAYKPAKVSSLKVVKAAETEFTLTWSKVKNASGYYIYQVAGGRSKKVAETKKTSYRFKNMKPEQTYKLKVVAFRMKDDRAYVGKTFSKTISVTLHVKKPAKPKNLKVSAKGNNKLKLSWDGVTGATGYKIFSYDKSAQKNKYKLVAKTSKTTYTVKNLKFGKKMTYAVQAYRKVSGAVAYSKRSKRASGKAVNVAQEVKTIHGPRFYKTTQQKTKVYNYTKKKNQTLPAGTQVAATVKYTINYKYVTAYLNNGNKIRIKGSVLGNTYGIQFDGKKDYSKAAKEKYINSKNLSSETKYLVWISQYTARVNVFKGSKGKWKLVRNFRCGLGIKGSPIGTYKIYKKERWSYEGLPMIYWMSSNSFHSMLGANVGETSSAGCIRCPADDLMYLYNKVPIDTTVYSR